MADYTKATNFTAKDGLPTGNAGKIVKGTEIDTELTAVSNAIASKADINSPTFTGTPASTTASAGTNTTQVATTAFVIAERTNTSTLTNKTLTSPTITGGTITGITDLAVADGGTGVSTLAANNVLLGNGTSALQTVAPGTSANVLTSNGTTWTSTAPAYIGARGQLFTASGTFTVPAGVTALKVTVVGGGGGGGGGSGEFGGLGATGSAGGTTSFGSLISNAGGTGGANYLGSAGIAGARTDVQFVSGNLTKSSDLINYGTGGAGGISTGPTGLQGGSNPACIGFFTGQTSGASITVTIGAGGAGGANSGASGTGFTGVSGACLVEW